jgi:hypothetical protein
LKVIQDAGDKGLMILIRCRPAIGNSVENQKKWEIFRIRLRPEVPIYHIFLAEDF